MEKDNKRTVALLDILGFGEMIKKVPLDELSKKYEYLINVAEYMIRPTSDPDTHSLFKNHTEGFPFCLMHVFSDTIILISHDDSEISCLKLMTWLWRLIQEFIGFQMPLRGAVTFGEMYINLNRNIFLGKALTTAYELERSQQWVGVAIDESLIDVFPELFKMIKGNNILSSIFMEYNVPFKDQKTKRLYTKRLHTVNWRWNLVVENGTRSLFLKTSDEDVIRKIENTLEYAKAVVATGKIYVKDQGSLPYELRSMFIGSSEPPFKHGDDL